MRVDTDTGWRLLAEWESMDLLADSAELLGVGLTGLRQGGVLQEVDPVLFKIIEDQLEHTNSLLWRSLFIRAKEVNELVPMVRINPF